MRRRYLWRNNHWVEIDTSAPPPRRRAPAILSDLTAYRSMRTGETIEGRAQHREHLRQYGLEEVGNEWDAFTAPREPVLKPGEIAEEVQRQLARDPGERRAEAERVLRQTGYDGPQVERILEN